MIKRSAVFFSRRSKAAVLAICALAVVAIGVIDFFTVRDVNSTLFCLPPVLLAAWYAGERYGVALAVLSAVGFFVTDQLWASEIPHHVAVIIWNSVVPFLFFIVSVRMLSMLKASYAREVALSRTDPLTGLNNRRYFNELCAGEIRKSARYGHPLTLAYMDLDNFKHVNDEYGHDAGDELLVLSAKLFAGSLRSTDIVARLGGDEFAVLLPESGAEAGAAAMNKLRGEFGEAMAGKGWPVTLSIGVVTYTSAPGSVQEMLKAADTLMYEVKSSGKNNIGRRVAGGSSAGGGFPTAPTCL